MGSARIEGNNTTLAEYLEMQEDKSSFPINEDYKEMYSIESELWFEIF